MTAKNDGGPAFPCDAEWRDGQEVWPQGAGMSLRDWYAGQAPVIDGDLSIPLAEALMCEPLPKSKTILENRRWWAEAEARLKYLNADAMIAARDAK